VQTHQGYRKIAIAELAKISVSLTPEKDMQYSLQSKFAVANLSGALHLALEIGKLANDIRLMASNFYLQFMQVHPSCQAK
jgi:aspartate ammonia-lyase